MKGSTRNLTVGLTTLTALLFAPVVPSQMEYQYAYQFEAGSHTGEQVVTQPDGSTTTMTFDDGHFVDEDGNGVISVAVFTDKNGNEVKIHIPDARYEDMGKRGGINFNPTKSEYRSVFDALVTPSEVEAAVAVGNALQPQVNSSVTSVTRSFTTSGDDIAIVTNALSTTAADMSHVRWNGADFLKAGELNPNAFSTETHYITAAEAGTFNIVWTNGSTATFVTTAVGYTGVNSTLTPTTDNNSGTSATVTGSLTTVEDDSWIVWTTRTQGSQPNSSGTNYTRRASNASNGVHIGDTNAAISPAGATSLSVGLSSSDSWAVFMLELEPVGAGGGGGATPKVFVPQSVF